MEKTNFSLSDAKKAIEWIETSPACSFWLKNALKQCLNRDPVDA